MSQLFPVDVQQWYDLYLLYHKTGSDDHSVRSRFQTRIPDCGCLSLMNVHASLIFLSFDPNESFIMFSALTTVHVRHLLYCPLHIWRKLFMVLFFHTLTHVHPSILGSDKTFIMVLD